MDLNRSTTIRDLYGYQRLVSLKGSWVSSVGDRFAQQIMDLTIENIHTQHPTWSVEDMMFGIQNVARTAEKHAIRVIPLYTQREIDASPDKAQAQIIYLPAPEAKESSFCLLLSGGGYGAVCNLAEAFPVAARLNELGVSCFCLNYRTASEESFVSGLLPKPLEDIAAALRSIHRGASHFGLDPNRYLLGGFSAGGHLAALWGTNHLGARHFGLPQPELLLLGYPMTDTGHLPDGPLSEYMKTGLYGAGWTANREERFAAQRYIDADYPPVYVAAARDDDTIPPADTADFETALRAAGRPCIFEFGAKGGHGFGLGSKTDVNGWVDRAMAFWEEIHGKE